MIVFRPFRNTDPPALVEIWNVQTHQVQQSRRSLAEPMTIELFEGAVLSKPYFDRRGLIVAVEQSPSGNIRDDVPIAFCHAGFGFRDDGQAISREAGAVYLTLSRPREQEAQLRQSLLALAENYLRDAGAKSIYAGSAPTCDAFYIGLRQGAQGSGLLDSDAQSLEQFRAAGYRETPRVSIQQRRLAGFRPQVDRQQMQIRRGHSLEVALDPAPETWREACTLGAMDRTSFMLFSKAGNGLVGRAAVWDMAPLAASWGVSAMGLSHFGISADFQRRGLGLFLMGEVMRHLQTQGASLVEVHIPLDNAPALAWLGKLGFEEIDRGVEQVNTL